MADPVDFLEQSSREFASYLQSYTAASVALLGRWPNFVPEEERFADTLEKGSEAATRGFRKAFGANGLFAVRVLGPSRSPISAARWSAVCPQPSFERRSTSAPARARATAPGTRGCCIKTTAATRRYTGRACP